MNGFDMIIIVVLVYCIIRGVFRGFVREVASIVGLLAGFYTAYNFYGTVAPLLSGWIKDPGYAALTGFLLLFCGVFLAVTVIGILIRFIMKMALLGVLDRIIGALFGALKGVLIISLLFFLLVRFLPPKGASIVHKSRLSPFANAISADIVRLIPRDMREGFVNRLDELKKGKPKSP